MYLCRTLERRIYDIMSADALIKQLLQIEHKLAKENAETNGWNVTDERAAVTEQFCAAIKTR